MLSIYLIALSAAACMARAPSFDGKTQGAFVPFTDDSKGMQTTPKIRISMPGMPQPIKVQMDTGSCGYTFSWVDLVKFHKGLRQDQHGNPVGYEPGHLFLSSSKVLKKGVWVPMEISFVDTPGTKANVPILAVTQKIVCDHYDNKRPGECPSPTKVIDMPSGVNYLGVGFGREDDGMEQSTPDKNPLLHLVTVGGQPVDLRRYNPGFVVMNDGLHIGLTQSNTHHFGWQQLSRRSNVDMDWQMANMGVRVETPNPDPAKGTLPPNYEAQGHLLVDTGVPQMYLTLPKNYPGGVATVLVPNESNPGLKSRDLVRQTNVRVDMGAAGFWSFVRGGNDRTEPSHVYTMMMDPAVKAPFVNSGRAFLIENDIAFDALNGNFGTRKHIEER